MTDSQNHLSKRNNRVANKESCDRAVLAALRSTEKVYSDSRIYDAKKEANIPRFSRDDVILGRLVGRGGFNDVYEVQQLNNDCRIEGTTSQSRYAIKYLSVNTMHTLRLFRSGASDLTKETKLLSSLNHPNIVKIRGVCDKGAAGFSSGIEGGYFILLDLFNDTLDKRIARWQKEEKKSRGIIKRVTDRNYNMKRQLAFAQRLKCAFDISSAIKYLHDNDIVYRDLKPTNIGIDCSGNIKVFDFGIAKELHPRDRFDDGLYNITKRAGSLRYMAPEVAQKKPYNLSADIYSFSLLLWELCSLTLPYDNMLSTDHERKVVNGNYRPIIDKSWPGSLRSLMERGWSSNLHRRPTIKVFYDILQDEIVAHSGGDISRAKPTFGKGCRVSYANQAN